MQVGARQSGSSIFVRIIFWCVLITPLLNLQAAELQAGDPNDSSCVRIACFNVESLTVPGEWSRFARYRFPPGRMQHLEGVAAVVEVVNPDILVLSEVSSAESCVALAALLRDKGLGDFQSYHVDGRDGYTGFDVAFLSRVQPDKIQGRFIHLFAPNPTPRLRDIQNGSAPLPWTAERYKKPEEEGGDVEAIAVLKRHAVCFFSLFGHKLGLIGLHLKSNPSDAQANAQRMAEATIVRRIVQREIVKREYSPILLGDLNDYDPDVEMADSTRKTQTSVLRLLKDIDPQRDGDELVNAAAHIPRVADRFSSHWDYNENGAADGDDVFTLIDHILLEKQLATGLTRAFICHANSLEISDHFPVIVDLDLSAIPSDRSSK